MSQQHIDLWRQTADAFDQRHQAISEAQWAEGTPCSEWAVKELVEHAVGVQQMFAGGMVGAELAEGADWPAVHGAVSTALETEGVLDGMTNHPMMGEVPKSMLFGIATNDLLLHTWDLARAIGADESLPEEAVMACYMGMQKMPQEGIRAEGRFADAIECADDADTQTKLLMFSGRQV